MGTENSEKVSDEDEASEANTVGNDEEEDEGDEGTDGARDSEGDDVEEGKGAQRSTRAQTSRSKQKDKKTPASVGTRRTGRRR